MSIVVVVKKPGESPKAETLNTKAGWTFGDIVGGMPGGAMKAYGFFEDGTSQLVVYCNDNGLAENLPFNFNRPSDGAPIVGTVVAVKYDRDHDEDLSMSDNDVQRTVDLLNSMSPTSVGFNRAQPLVYEGRPHTPWAVICPEHGQVCMTNEEYMYQMRRPDSTWKCPICGKRSGFDDDNYEGSLGEPNPLDDDQFGS